MDNLCINCRYFHRDMRPKLNWDERKKLMIKNHPTITPEEAAALADCLDLFEKEPHGSWGKCKNQKLPQLRDVDLLGEDFGCVHFKK